MTHFSDAKINEIRRFYHAGFSAAVVAARLGCSRRTIVDYYRLFRGSERIARKEVPPQPKPKAAPPDRFYHSNFEPS